MATFPIYEEIDTGGEDITGVTCDDPQAIDKFKIGQHVTFRGEGFIVFAKYVNTTYGRLHFVRERRHGPAVRLSA